MVKLNQVEGLATVVSLIDFLYIVRWRGHVFCDFGTIFRYSVLHTSMFGPVSNSGSFIVVECIGVGA